MAYLSLRLGLTTFLRSSSSSSSRPFFFCLSNLKSRNTSLLTSSTSHSHHFRTSAQATPSGTLILSLGNFQILSLRASSYQNQLNQSSDLSDGDQSIKSRVSRSRSTCLTDLIDLTNLLTLSLPTYSFCSLSETLLNQNSGYQISRPDPMDNSTFVLSILHSSERSSSLGPQVRLLSDLTFESIFSRTF